MCGLFPAGYVEVVECVGFFQICGGRWLCGLFPGT